MSSEEIEKALGFSSFTSNKHARKFEFMELFNEAKNIAKERNEEGNKKLAALEAKLAEESENESTAPKSDVSDADSDVDGGEMPGPKDSKETEPDDPYFVPMTDVLLLKHGPKPLTAVAVDPSGSRVATGGFEFEVKLWDFSGMDKSCRAFKCFQPFEDNQIKDLEFSPSGESLLIVSASPQAKIMTRDGEFLCETIRGYQYITDPASAKGHTHSLKGGTWHPIDGRKFLTWSHDTTIRTWIIDDAETIVNDTRIPKYHEILRPKTAQGRKVIPTACAYSRDGFLVAAGCQDGSLQVWDTRKPLVNTAHLLRGAHPPGTETTSVCWSWDARSMATRATDDTLRLWDIRNMRDGAVHTVRDLPVLFDQTAVCFSPNDTLLVAAVSAGKGDPSSGQVIVYRRDTFEPVVKHSPGQGSAIRVLWHPRINQIVATFSSGLATVHFDPTHSRNGALMCAYRQASDASRRRRQGHGSSDAFIKPVLLTFDEESVRIARKMRKRFGNLEDETQLAVAAVITASERDQVAANEAANKAAKKRAPPAGEDVGQRVGSLHRYMVQQIVLKKNEADERAERDIRGAILRHAEAAKEKPFWTKAYLKTQPNPIFQKEKQEDEGPSGSKKPRPPPI
ncbi:hypothetical protein AAHC03_05145 [Spirometra sp. Aus1]|nr:unnamed protein product [Spirometra erinaceieuropaei]